MLTDLITSFPGARTAWTYDPSRPRLGIVLRRWRARWKREPAPEWKALVPVTRRQRWLVYFIYVANGQLDAGHHYTLDQLAREDASLMVICACPKEHPVLEELRSRCDALYWKAQNGWDFSAYAVALSALAQLSTGADVLVLNDSVYGPFRPLVPFMDAATWRLTGFTANALEENHVQSYAFIVKSIDKVLMQLLDSVMSTSWSYNAADPVILLQETLLARVAHRHISVGAFFYADGSRYQDLCLNCPAALVDAGFPFLKRSLFGKFAGSFQDPAAMQVLLQRLGHPFIKPVGDPLGLGGPIV